MPHKPNAQFLWKLAYFALGIAAAWVFFRYLFIWLLPFIIAFLIARLIEPTVAFLTKRLKIKRPLSSAICLILTFGAIAGILYLAASRIVFETGELLRQLPDLLAKLPPLTERVKDKVYELIISVPTELQDFLTKSFEGFLSRGISIPANLYSFLASFVSSTVLSIPAAMISVAACVLSAYFMSRDYRAFVEFMLRQFPNSLHDKLLRSKDHLVSTFGKWLRAQAILMGLTFAETAVGLAVAGVEYFLLLALVVAFVDALPVLGSGTVLLPWGIVTLFAGNPAKGILIILTFLIVSLVRSLTEPRLVGKQIGLHPLATVASMYIGFKAIGVWGLLLFPITVIMLKQLQEWDYIRLWK